MIVLSSRDVRDQLLHLAVLLLELLQPPQLGDPQAPVELLSPKERTLGDLHLPTHLCDRGSGLHVAQRHGDPLLAVAALPHAGLLPLLGGSSVSPQDSFKTRARVDQDSGVGAATPLP